MVNIRPDGRWFGFNVQPEHHLPGLHNFRPPVETVPGFRMNADGSVRGARWDGPSFSDGPQGAQYVTLETFSDTPLTPFVPEPPFLKVVPSPPSAQEWPERGNRLVPPFEQIERLYWLEKGKVLGIPEEAMRDPDWRPPEWHSDQIQIDPHGRIAPRQPPWPWRRPFQ